MVGQPLVTVLYSVKSSQIQQTLVVPRSSFFDLRSTSGVVYLDKEKTPILFDVCTLFIPQDCTFTSRHPIFVYTKDIFSRLVGCRIISSSKGHWALAYQVSLNVLIYKISIMYLQQLDLHYDDFVLTWLPRLRCGPWSSILQHRLWSLCHSGMERSRHGGGFSLRTSDTLHLQCVFTIRVD